MTTRKLHDAHPLRGGVLAHVAAGSTAAVASPSFE